MIKKAIVILIFLLLYGTVGHYDQAYGATKIKATKHKIMKFECTQKEYDHLKAIGTSKTVLKLACQKVIK